MNRNEIHLSDAIDVIEEVLASGGDFRIYPKGISMQPLIIQKRDSVTLTRNTYPIKKHDLVFYRRKNGQFVLHRVMKVCEDGTFVMCGDNQTVLEKGIEPEQVIAKVCEIHRKNKPINMSGAAYSTYVFFWTKRPIRVVGIFLKRAINKLFRIFKGVFCKNA